MLLLLYHVEKFTSLLTRQKLVWNQITLKIPVVVWSLSYSHLFATPWTTAHTKLPCPSLSPEVAQTHVH